MIPPRGCAYIVMVHRQDANTALNKLSRGSYKVNQKPMKVRGPSTNAAFVPLSLAWRRWLRCIVATLIFFQLHADRVGVKQGHKVRAQKVLGCGARSHLHSLGQSQSGGVGHVPRGRDVGRGDVKSR